MLMPAGDTHSDSELYRMAMEADVDAMIYLGSFHNGLLTRLIKDGISSVVVDTLLKDVPQIAQLLIMPVVAI